MTKKARKRITFASLYLGTGTLEQELVCGTVFLCIHFGRRKFGHMQTQNRQRNRRVQLQDSTADTGLEKDLT